MSHSSSLNRTPVNQSPLPRPTRTDAACSAVLPANTNRPLTQNAAPISNSVSRRRPSSSIPSAPAAQRPCLIDDRRGVVFPHIAGHRSVHNGRVEFHIQYDRNPANDKWLPEYKIEEPTVHYKLHDYRVKTSGVMYRGKKGGNFSVDRVLDHRIDNDGNVVYFVKWAGKFNHPVWRSEPINPRDNGAGLYAQYNSAHGLPPLPR